MEFFLRTKSILMFCLIIVITQLNFYAFSHPSQGNIPFQPDKIDDLNSWFRCPEGWILNSDSSKCLRVFDTTLSWPESLDFCREYGGDLASIHSETDLITVKYLIYEDTWIGLNDVNEHGVMEWSDGSAVDFSSWAPGEPNNMNGTENCVNLGKNVNFDFTVNVCSENKRFICQKIKNEELPVFRCPQSWIMNSNSSKCFHVISITQSWQESLNFCRAFGGDLASLHSESDFILAKSMVSEDTWIGLNDIEIEGVMEWSDSSTVDFISWGSGQPDNQNNSESCVDMHSEFNFHFDDDNCNEKESFMCQKIPSLVYNCSEGWIPNSDSSKCYGAITATYATWEESLNICREFGGDLASLHSEIDFILAKSLISDDTWIGLNDIDDEGVFVWSDSSPVDFTSWGAGNPNNGGDQPDQNCADLHIVSGFDFDDDYCSKTKWFLCQIVNQVDALHA